MEKQLDQILNDDFLKQLQDENFDSQTYVSNLITNQGIEDLIQLSFELQKKSQTIQKFSENLCKEDSKFFENQFKIPNQYGAYFDRIKNSVIQGKRKIKQSREILLFNSEKLKQLNQEIKQISEASKELQVVDQINELIQNISIFMKQELFQQSAELIQQVKDSKDKINFEKQSLISQQNFDDIIYKKQSEFYINIKEKFFRLFYEIFDEQYSNDYMIFIQNNQQNQNINFDKENKNFKYFEKKFLDKSNEITVYFQDQFLQQDIFNEQIPKIKEMIDLYFDTRVIEFLRQELKNPSSNTSIEDLKFIEIIESAKILDENKTLLDDFIMTLDFRLVQYFLSITKFFLFMLKDSKLANNFRSMSHDSSSYYFILSKLKNAKFLEIFAEILIQMIIFFWQKLGILLKACPFIKDYQFNKIFQIFFSVLQKYIENFFLQKELVTFLETEFYESSQEIQNMFDLNQIHSFLLINKLNPEFNHLIDTFSRFILKPDKQSVIRVHFDNFEDGLFLKFKMKIRTIYQTNIQDQVSKFEKIQTVNLVNQERRKSENLQNSMNISQIMSQSMLIQKDSQKKHSNLRQNTIKLINDFNKFCFDMNFFMDTKIVQNNQFIYNQFLQFYNLAMKVMFDSVYFNIEQKSTYQKICNLKTTDYFGQNLKKIKNALFKEEQITMQTQQRLEAFLEQDYECDFNTHKENFVEFWFDEQEIEFQEKCFICLKEFMFNEKMFYEFLIKLWTKLDMETINKISIILDLNFQQIKAEEDLRLAKKQIEKQEKYYSIQKKIQAGMDLPLYENIIMIIYNYYEFRKKILNLFFFLKVNFDYMVFQFFEKQSEKIKNYNEYDLKFFNTANQIFDFRKQMISYDKMARNYLQEKSQKRYFVLDSLDLFFKRFHNFIFEIKPVFQKKQSYLKNYYVEFCKVLKDMEIMSEYNKEIIDKSLNYKFMKKLLNAEDDEEVEEIGIFYNLENEADELEMAKKSILLTSQIINRDSF